MIVYHSLPCREDLAPTPIVKLKPLEYIQHDPELGTSGGLVVLTYVIDLLNNGLGWLLASISLYACGGFENFGYF
jgi:hypothetical protein